MFDVLKFLIDGFVGGGTTAIVTILVLVIIALIYDRRTLLKTLTDTTQKVYDAKDSENESIREIVDRYHQGSLDLVQALNEIKIVLASIQTKR